MLDASAILAVLLGEEGAERVMEVLRAAARQEEVRVMVPFTALEEIEVFLLRRFPGEVGGLLALVESWPVQVPESYPQWSREAARLQATLGLSRPRAWAAALALLHDAELVHKDPALEGVPGLRQVRLP